MTRLFVGAKVCALWPKFELQGHYLPEDTRHATLAFLGKADANKLVEELSLLPALSFSVGLGGTFDRALLLPEQDARVVCWHVAWQNQELTQFQSQLSHYLETKGYALDSRPWLSHVSVCRSPVHPQQWVDAFYPLACFVDSIHLYESLGHGQYRSLWSRAFHLPFQEIEHTADLAFHIFGENLDRIYENAFLALAFQEPQLCMHWTPHKAIGSLDDVVILLNDAICRLDQTTGSPFKAVSFHGQVELFQCGFKWEMIVDI